MVQYCNFTQKYCNDDYDSAITRITTVINGTINNVSSYKIS